ncbi:hypothetical protein EYC84_006548 [Monilinia fructicola]|uniref:Ribophorin II C-terminal domain-containing protein n=1 Tax=Monilinia fructicola TaxID=38448 RepID=A0A5M9K7F1_MONFR|nr:hypothetical protein EYC84_006548 [Monilinia fructicola]
MELLMKLYCFCERKGCCWRIQGQTIRSCPSCKTSIPWRSGIPSKSSLRLLKIVLANDHIRHFYSSEIKTPDLKLPFHSPSRSLVKERLTLLKKICQSNFSQAPNLYVPPLSSHLLVPRKHLATILTHIFRPDPQSGPKIFSLAFALAVIATVPVLLGAWAYLGANLSHLSKATSAAPISHGLFYGSIIAMEGIFFLYYSSWTLFQTLPAAGCDCVEVQKFGGSLGLQIEYVIYEEGCTIPKKEWRNGQWPMCNQRFLVLDGIRKYLCCIGKQNDTFVFRFSPIDRYLYDSRCVL